MNSDFESILEECLVKIRTGASLEDCLSAYPSQAEALSPLLLAYGQIKKISRPQERPEAVEAGLERVIGSMAIYKATLPVKTSPISKPWLTRYAERIITSLKMLLIGKETTGMKFALRIALDVMVILLVGGAMTVHASSPSLPGDPLYNVKRTWEEVQISLTVNDQARQQLQEQIQQLRLSEVREMIQKGRTGTVEFYGVVESISANELVVSGLHINMLPNTLVDGVPTVGQLVQVMARIQSDGTLTALQVSVQTQLQNPYPSSLPSQVPQTTPVPSQVPWSTYDHHNDMPGSTYQPTYQPWSTDDHHDMMPGSTSQPTYQPWSTYDHHDMMPGSTPVPPYNHDSNHDQCQDCGQYYNNGGSSWTGNDWGMHH